MEIYSSNSFESMGLNYVTVSILFHAQAKDIPKISQNLAAVSHLVQKAKP